MLVLGSCKTRGSRPEKEKPLPVLCTSGPQGLQAGLYKKLRGFVLLFFSSKACLQIMETLWQALRTGPGPHVLALRTFPPLPPKSLFNTSTKGYLHNPPGTERPSERKACVKSKLQEERPISAFYQFTECTQKVPNHCLSFAFCPQI